MTGPDWKNHRLQGTVRVSRADVQSKKVYAMPMALDLQFFLSILEKVEML